MMSMFAELFAALMSNNDGLIAEARKTINAMEPDTIELWITYEGMRLDDLEPPTYH